ncbi:Phytochrome-like protein cph2 [Marinomonas spartinae]|uniref:diguanylate cyclase n=1 Tax=Marinomonas spartinae TaxID=1792290 RepID=A0A1A8TGX9_9GAMM|nr:diguanylate cyclase [Marinomonas spartinae]SBS31284.1 Phytochrome-like protein cph2 [Marinomonas spartinae]
MKKLVESQRSDILIIDDDRTVVIALNKALKDLGRVRFALNSKQAFVMIEERLPDLILLDVELPDMRGLEVCSTLKNRPDTKSIPVLFITSNTEVGFEEKVFDVGGADYIAKPLNPRVVAARAKTHVAYHRAIELLEKLAHTDAMTGLANRRTFDEQLAIEFKRCYREQEPLTVAIIDIDEFKKYNDHFGHIAGDECIKSIASALIRSARRPVDLVARYGGEEFALLFPNTHAEGVGMHLDNLLHTIEQLNLTHAPSATHDVVTISIGYSTLTCKQAARLDDWDVVQAADKALYESKEKGRNRVSFAKVDAPSSLT